MRNSSVETLTAKNWLLPPRRGEPARLRLICWPYAGIGPSLFVDWARRAPDGLAVYGVQAPGHEARLSEPPLRRLDAMLDGLTAGLAAEPALLDAPYALVGCSFGAIAGYELARRLLAAGVPAPVAQVVFACRPPHAIHPVGPFGALGDLDLLEQLDRDYGGVPEILRQESELMRVFVRGLRGDLEAIESYAPPATPAPLPCPIHAFGGRDDATVPPEVLRGWTAYGAAGSTAELLPGGHFLLREDPAACLEAVLGRLEAWVP